MGYDLKNKLDCIPMGAPHREDHHTPLTPYVEVWEMVGNYGKRWVSSWNTFFGIPRYHVTKRDFRNRQVNEVMRYINSDGLHSHTSRGFGFSRDCCRLNFDGINDPPRYQLVMGNMAKPCETNC